MATQEIDREITMDRAETAKRITATECIENTKRWLNDNKEDFDEDDLINLIDKMLIVKPVAYMVCYNLTLIKKKLKDTDGDPKLIEAYDIILSLISKMEPYDRLDFNF